MTHSNKQVTKVTIPYTYGGKDQWNLLCANIMEAYGLPGERYTWHPEENFMEFHFTDERDAITCILRFL